MNGCEREEEWDNMDGMLERSTPLTSSLATCLPIPPIRQELKFTVHEGGSTKTHSGIGFISGHCTGGTISCFTVMSFQGLFSLEVGQSCHVTYTFIS